MTPRRPGPASPGRSRLPRAQPRPAPAPLQPRPVWGSGSPPLGPFVQTIRPRPRPGRPLAVGAASPASPPTGGATPPPRSQLRRATLMSAPATPRSSTRPCRQASQAHRTAARTTPVLPIGGHSKPGRRAHGHRPESPSPGPRPPMESRPGHLAQWSTTRSHPRLKVLKTIARVSLAGSQRGRGVPAPYANSLVIGGLPASDGNVVWAELRVLSAGGHRRARLST